MHINVFVLTPDISVRYSASKFFRIFFEVLRQKSSGFVYLTVVENLETCSFQLRSQLLEVEALSPQTETRDLIIRNVSDIPSMSMCNLFMDIVETMLDDSLLIEIAYFFCKNRIVNESLLFSSINLLPYRTAANIQLILTLLYSLQYSEINQKILAPYLQKIIVLPHFYRQFKELFIRLGGVNPKQIAWLIYQRPLRYEIQQDKLDFTFIEAIGAFCKYHKLVSPVSPLAVAPQRGLHHQAIDDNELQILKSNVCLFSIDDMPGYSLLIAKDTTRQLCQLSQLIIQTDTFDETEKTAIQEEWIVNVARGCKNIECLDLSENKLSTSLIKMLINWTGVKVVLDRVVKQREIPKNPSFAGIFESELFDVDSLYYYSLPGNLQLLHDYLQKNEFREFIELVQHEDFVTVLLEIDDQGLSIFTLWANHSIGHVLIDILFKIESIRFEIYQSPLFLSSLFYIHTNAKGAKTSALFGICNQQDLRLIKSIWQEVWIKRGIQEEFINKLHIAYNTPCQLFDGTTNRTTTVKAILTEYPEGSMLRSIKQFLESYVPYFAAGTSDNDDQSSSLSLAADLIEKQGLKLVSQQHLLTRSRAKPDYENLQKQLGAERHTLEKWLRANQWPAFLEKLYVTQVNSKPRMPIFHESAFYYWTKWGLQSSTFGEELLSNQALQQQLSTHHLCIPALFAVAEDSLTALHWLFLARCQKKPKHYLNIFLNALSQALPNYAPLFLDILLQPVSDDAAGKCLLENLAEYIANLESELSQIFSPSNQECLIQQIHKNPHNLGKLQLVACLKKIQDSYPENIFFAQLAVVNREQMFIRLQTDMSYFLLCSASKNARRELANAFTIDSFACQWKSLQFSDANLLIVIKAVQNNIFNNLNAKLEQEYLPELFSTLCEHPQIADRIQTKTQYESLKKWLYPEPKLEPEPVTLVVSELDSVATIEPPLKTIMPSQDQQGLQQKRQPQSARISKRQKRAAAAASTATVDDVTPQQESAIVPSEEISIGVKNLNRYDIDHETDIKSQSSNDIQQDNGNPRTADCDAETATIATVNRANIALADNPLKLDPKVNVEQPLAIAEASKTKSSKQRSKDQKKSRLSRQNHSEVDISLTCETVESLHCQADRADQERIIFSVEKPLGQDITIPTVHKFKSPKASSSIKNKSSANHEMADNSRTQVVKDNQQLTRTHRVIDTLAVIHTNVSIKTAPLDPEAKPVDVGLKVNSLGPLAMVDLSIEMDSNKGSPAAEAPEKKTRRQRRKYSAVPTSFWWAPSKEQAAPVQPVVQKVLPLESARCDVPISLIDTEEDQVTSLNPVIFEITATAQLSPTAPSPLDPKTQFETMFEIFGSYYTDTSSRLPQELKEIGHKFLICNDDSSAIASLLDKLVKKLESSTKKHPMCESAKDVLQKIPLDIDMAKYYCLCLQIDGATYDLQEYAYIISLIRYSNSTIKTSAVKIRNASDWLCQENKMNTEKERLRQLVYDLVWFAPLIERVSEESHKISQGEISSRHSLEILQRRNDAFGLVCRAEYSTNQLVSVCTPKRLDDYIPLETDDDRKFQLFLRWLCHEESHVYLVGSRATSATPFDLKGNDFDFDIHYCNMSFAALENPIYLYGLTYEWLRTLVQRVWPGQQIIRCASDEFNQHYRWYSFKVNFANRKMDFRFLCTDQTHEAARIFSQSERCYSPRACVWSLKDNMVYGFLDSICEVTKLEEYLTYNNVCYLLRCVVKENTLQACSPRLIDIINQVILRYERNFEDKQRIDYTWWEQTKNKPDEGTADLAIKTVIRMRENLLRRTDNGLPANVAVSSGELLAPSFGNSPLSLFGADSAGALVVITPSSTVDVQSQSPVESIDDSSTSSKVVPL